MANIYINVKTSSAVESNVVSVIRQEADPPKDHSGFIGVMSILFISLLITLFIQRGPKLTI